MDWFDNWALTLAVFIPIVGMVIVLVIPRAEETLIKVVALLTTLVTGAVGIGILADFDLDDGRLQFTANERWIDVINSRYHVGIDGISLPLVLLTMLVTICCVVYSWNHFPEPHNPKAFLALMLLLETGMIGTFVAQDLILFFIFFEVVLLPMFFMIGVWGGPNREYASIKFFLFTLFGSALDAAELPGALLPVGRADLRHRHADAPARRRHRARHAVADLRRDVPRLRDQGADVPVPHLAARRPHRGADGGLGAAGRDHAEARHLRVHPHRARRRSRARRSRGRRGSACWR